MSSLHLFDLHLSLKAMLLFLAAGTHEVSKGISVLVDPAILAAAVAFISAVIRDFIRHTREIRSTNTAVLAEVQRLLDVATKHKNEWWDKLDANGKKRDPLIAFTFPIYQKQAKNLGRLEPAVAGKVAKFFGYLEFLNSLQATRKQYIDADAFPKFEEAYSKSLATFLATFQNKFTDDFSKFGLNQ